MKIEMPTAAGDGIHRRGLEDSKIESARKFLYESSDDDSFASNISSNDNFPVNVTASMPQRTGYGGRRGTTNLSGANIHEEEKPEPSRYQRCCNTLFYRGKSRNGRDSMKKICALMVITIVLVFGLVVMNTARKNGNGIFAMHNNANNANDGRGSSSGGKTHGKLKGNRQEKFHQLIVEEEISSAEDLDTPGSAQALALEWVAHHDGAKLKPEDPQTVQRYALAVLFYATAGTNELENAADAGHWMESLNWLSKKGICAWSGVTCEGDLPDNVEKDASDKNLDHHGFVERLELTELGLMGDLPAELAALTRLYKLDLSKNDLKGTIPKEFAQLTGLRELLLSHNLLTGVLFEGFGDLTNLRHLILGNNRLTGEIPDHMARHLTELRSLSLEGNDLTGEVPDLEQLTKITNFNVQDNQLTGRFPTSITKLTNLVQLNLGRNHLTGTFPEEMMELTALEKLLLREMNLHGTIPDELFTRVTRLTELGLSNNKLSGTIPSSVGKLKDLHGFFIGQNKLTGSIPRQVGLMADLTILEVQGNKLSGSIPNLVSALNGLEIFSAARNHLTGTIPPEVGQMHRLQSFFVENNKLTGGVPTEMGKLHALKQCRIYDNRLDGEIPDEVCELIDDEDLVFLGADCGHKFTCDCCTKCY